MSIRGQIIPLHSAVQCEPLSEHREGSLATQARGRGKPNADRLVSYRREYVELAYQMLSTEPEELVTCMVVWSVYSSSKIMLDSSH